MKTEKIEFTPPEGWKTPRAEDRDKEGYYEGIIRFQMRNGKICVYEFEGIPVGEGKKLDEHPEEQPQPEEHPMPAPEEHLKSMMESPSLGY